MLLVETYVAPSGIHGMGCFARDFIPKGTRVWKYDMRVDRGFRESRLSKYPESFQKFVKFHCFAVDFCWMRYLILPGDNDRYMNHSDSPNVFKQYAVRDIEAGEEMTCDYWDCDLDAAWKLGENSSRDAVESHTKSLAT